MEPRDWRPSPLSAGEQLFLVHHHAPLVRALASRGVLHVNASGIFHARGAEGWDELTLALAGYVAPHWSDVASPTIDWTEWVCV